MLNFICDNRITQPKMASQFYDAVVPTQAKAAIAKRDAKTK
jgi:hypothetical protein